MKNICFCTHLHENAKKRKKNENAKKRKRKRTQKNENAYFQDRRRIFSRTKTPEKTQTKNQILGERCQLSSGEYCTRIHFILLYILKCSLTRRHSGARC